jgi:hypothetical protein
VLVVFVTSQRHPENESLEKRWERMCAGPERYDAMREADEKGRPNPCSC